MATVHDTLTRLDNNKDARQVQPGDRIYFSTTGYNTYAAKLATLENTLLAKYNSPDNIGMQTEIGLLEEKISSMKNILMTCQVVDYSKNNRLDTICLGHRVTLEKDGIKEQYDIVGFGECDTASHPQKIQYNSPLARSIIGKSKDSVVNANINYRSYNIKILDIEKIPLTDIDFR